MSLLRAGLCFGRPFSTSGFAAKAHKNKTLLEKIGLKKTSKAQARSGAETISTDAILLRALNLTNTTNVRCTVIDKVGKVQATNAEFKRSDLLSTYGLLARDMRKLDVSAHNIVPSILVRESSILVNLMQIRALIKCDTVLLFESSMNHSTQQAILYELSQKLSLRRDALPYELHALEVILSHVVLKLDADLEVQRIIVTNILSELDKRIDDVQLRRLLVESKKLSAFLQSSTLIRDTLVELIDSDEELAGLYLSAKAAGKPVLEDGDLSTAELMLESYCNNCDEVVQSTQNLIDNIRNTEEVANIVLDANRNTLMLLELRFQIGMLGLAAGSIIAALYGMNLKNFIEESNFGFPAMTLLTCAFTFISIFVFLRRLHRLQRINLGEKRAAERRGINKVMRK